MVVSNTHEYDCIKFSALNIQRLKFYEAKTSKKREIPNIFKVLYLNQKSLNLFEILIEYACNYY